MKFLQIVNSNCYFQEVNLNNRVLHHPTGCVPNSFEHVFNPDATAAAEESFWGFSCCASHKGRPDAELAEGRDGVQSRGKKWEMSHLISLVLQLKGILNDEC